MAVVENSKQSLHPDSSSHPPPFVTTNEGSWEDVNSVEAHDFPKNFTSEADPRSSRTYYINHEAKPRSRSIEEPLNLGSSLLNPVKLAELEATGILDAEIDKRVSDGRAGDDWPWIIKEIIEWGPQNGEPYWWVNYRQTPEGCANNRSPEDTKTGYVASAEARVARERREEAERNAKI